MVHVRRAQSIPKTLAMGFSKRKVCHTSDCDVKSDKVPKHTAPVPHALMKEDIDRYSGERRLHSQRDDIVLGNAQHAQKKPKLLGPILSNRFASI